MGRTDGMVKIIAEPDTQLILGVGMVGPHASELIAEGTLALEMGATLEDLMVTIHPHPTLSEGNYGSIRSRRRLRHPYKRPESNVGRATALRALF